MALYPHAKHRLMPYNNQLPARLHSKTLILHTNAGGTDHGSLYGWFARPGNDICSHLQVMNNGTIEQYLDTDREGYAQYAGNAYGVSVETEDDGNPSRPWTPQQLTAIVNLARWLGCPPRISPDGAGGGVGWHSLYTDWNRDGHQCPGHVRAAQVHSVVLPALENNPRPHPHPAHPTLRRGDKGLAVRQLQTLLNTKRHASLTVDGVFGPATEHAVTAMKKALNLTPVDGIAGIRIWKALGA